MSIFFSIKNFIYLFLSALGLRCYAWAFSSCGDWWLLFIVVCRLLIVVASLVVKHGPEGGEWALAVVAHRLSCSEVCGILLDQGWNLCSPHWQADFHPLDHQEVSAFKLSVVACGI